jgi:hypothetical protein
MKCLNRAIVVAAVAVSASSANAATWLRYTISGVVETGTDLHGDFGPIGADLAGTPYSFSLYYRDRDIRQLTGNSDSAVTARWTSGFVGDLKIPFNSSGAGWQLYEDDSYEVRVLGNAELGYPGLYAYISSLQFGRPYREASIL